jgi:acyl-coenzyme A thioesterase PaaI-like protein
VGHTPAPSIPETWRTRLIRWGFNLFPAYRGTGGRITYIAPDWHEVRVRLGLTWRTRNYVGTIFGGSLYGAVDPIYMIMLIKSLGPGYVVWDKAATIRFRKPGRSTLYARFEIAPHLLDAIRADLEGAAKIDRVFQVDLASADGTVHASVEKTIHIARRDQGGWTA